MVCEVLSDHVYRQIVLLLRFVKFYLSIVVPLNRLSQHLKDHILVQGHVLHLVVGQYYHTINGIFANCALCILMYLLIKGSVSS